MLSIKEIFFAVVRVSKTTLVSECRLCVLCDSSHTYNRHIGSFKREIFHSVTKSPRPHFDFDARTNTKLISPMKELLGF